MADDLICQPFERTDGVYTLSDAICLTPDRWAEITPEEVDAIQQSRWDVWRANINAEPVPPPDTDPQE